MIKKECVLLNPRYKQAGKRKRQIARFSQTGVDIDTDLNTGHFHVLDVTALFNSRLPGTDGRVLRPEIVRFERGAFGSEFRI